MKSGVFRIILALFPAACAFAGNNVVNMSHYDMLWPDFVAMKNEGVLGIIHEASYPKFERDGRYFERERMALSAGLLWGAYHFGDGTNPIQQADHFLSVVAGSQPMVVTTKEPEKKRPGVLLVLDFEKNDHYPGGTMTLLQAAAFVEQIKERTGKYPGLYGSENRLRQMLYGPGSTPSLRQTLSNCWLWVANYHAEPRSISPWGGWHLWQYTGDGKCGLRPRGSFPTGVANMRRAERNIFPGNNVQLQSFWQEHAWFPSG